jgi:UbiD family decarboxylase
MGSEVNLEEIPIPIWHPGDGGPYISVGIQVTKDPDSGVRNVSIVRQMLQRKDQLGILLLPGKHMATHYWKREQMNAPLDIAVAIGTDPIIEIIGCHKGPIEEDEFAVAGALRRKRVELVKCETVDLEVPATAELVIEGQLLPGERYPEGPFGEFTGALGPATDNNPPMKVTCITHRRNPIYQGLYVGKTPNEDACLGALTISASILAKARKSCPGLVAYAKSPYGPGTLWGIAAIKKTHPGHAKEAMDAIWKTQPGQTLSEAFMRFLVIVDHDVNVHDLKEVTWAISLRCRPERDIFLERDDGITFSGLAEDSKTGFSGRVMIDATEKWEKEGNVQRQKLISHSDSPYWEELSKNGLSSYLGVDMSMWEKKGH